VETTPIPARNLDVLRAVAVSCVLVNHIAVSFHASPRIVFTQIGNAGVLLFFVHTALVLMASLERHGQGPGWIERFYLRRAFRIYPLAVVVLLLVIGLNIPSGVPVRGDIHAFQPASWATIGANLLLMQNVVGERLLSAPYWSLPLEVQMYLLLPLCFLVARRKSLDMALLFAALVIAYLTVAFSGLPGAWRLTVFNYGPCFFAGVLAYHLLRRTSPTIRSGMFPFVVLAAVALVVLLGTTRSTFARAWVPCLLLGLVIPRIAELSESVVTRAAKTIATYSYGIYLLHVPVLWLAFNVGAALPLLLQLVIVVGGLVSFPWLAYQLIEDPGVRFARPRLVPVATTQGD
jgi:peptidoglycan/LPS O-acetylase OafA/YrhL